MADGVEVRFLAISAITRPRCSSACRGKGRANGPADDADGPGEADPEQATQAAAAASLIRAPTAQAVRR